MGTRTSLPGLLDIEASVYHADELDDTRPSLSKSIIAELIDKSPAHARVKHPRLNPEFVREEEDRFSVGTVVHSLFLEGIDAVSIAPYDDWRTKGAKDCRDAARECGKIPMLASQYEECKLIVEAIRQQCDAHAAGPFFRDGVAERTLVWTDEYDVLCRARLDWLTNDNAAIHDLKSTKASASHEAWSRTAIAIGADLQYAWYLRGCERALGFRPDFKFIVVEVAPPYAMSVFGLAPDALALAEKKIEYALRLWATCLRNDAWPSYSQEVAYIESPPWVEASWLARELREVA